MSDNYFENDPFRRFEESDPEPTDPAKETADAPSDEMQSMSEPLETAQNQENSADEAAAVSDYEEPQAFDTQPEQTQPDYQQPQTPQYSSPDPYSYASYTAPGTGSNPYVDPYRQANSAPSNQNAGYDDGFYHQRFDSQTGYHVNYTRPAASSTVRPATGYPTAQTQPEQRHSRERKKSGGLSKGGIALLLVVCVLISGLAGFGGSMIASKINQPQYESTASDTMVIHKVNTEIVSGTESALVEKSTAEITAEVADTVVEVTTEVMQTSSYYGQYIATGAGSGVIISEDGYILTNNHVIENATSITVTTRGGDSYEATLVGTDDEVDIALLKINATGLPVAVFGDSSTLEVGAKAVIIGNPLGTLGGSVTEGIISALDRSIVIDGKTMHLMQTDAAINPGNSGGGMFNGQGELTGIVVAKSSSEEIDNIGFVIPINNVLDILGDLKDYGYVRGRADTGMTFIDLTNQMYAWYYYRNSTAGVYISSVESGSTAASAGFRAGDRVISVDGQAVSSSDDIDAIISDKSVGDTVRFELDRSGSTGTLELTLQEEVPTGLQSSSNDYSYDNGYDPFSFFGR